MIVYTLSMYIRFTQKEGEVDKQQVERGPVRRVQFFMRSICNAVQDDFSLGLRS